MDNRTYYLVLYDERFPKGVIHAMPSILDQEAANVLLQDANPTIERRKEGRKYQVLSKRMFEYSNLDGSKTLFIICDVKRIK